MYFRAKCNRCGYLTIFELQIRGRLATKRCTSCNSRTTVPWTEDERAAIRDYEELLDQMVFIYPALRELSAPGDRVSPPENEDLV